MRTLIWHVIAPFLTAALVTAWLLNPLPVAWADACAGDEFWAVEDVTIQGADAPWPKDGHLYPGRLALWAEGATFELEYAP